MRFLPAKFLLLILFFTQALLAHAESGDQDVAQLNALLDGLHRDAAEANFTSYFNRYSDEAVFLGTDKSERWSIPEFKAYAKPAFDAGRGWRYDVITRHLEGSGEIRWFDEILLNQKLGYCRGTGVILLTDDGWKIAHYSLTILVPNEIAAEVGQQSLSVESRPK